MLFANARKSFLFLTLLLVLLPSLLLILASGAYVLFKQESPSSQASLELKRDISTSSTSQANQTASASARASQPGQQRPQATKSTGEEHQHASSLADNPRHYYQHKRTLEWTARPGRKWPAQALGEPALSSNSNINIILERNNFALRSRCSRNLVYVRVSKRTKLASIGAKEFKQPSEGDSRALRDSARMKLLSAVFTLEHVESSATGDQEQDMPVRLRSNLTELYICFNMKSSKLEAKVSIRPAVSGVRVCVCLDRFPAPSLWLSSVAYPVAGEWRAPDGRRMKSQPINELNRQTQQAGRCARLNMTYARLANTCNSSRALPSARRCDDALASWLASWLPRSQSALKWTARRVGLRARTSRRPVAKVNVAKPGGRKRFTTAC